MTQKFFNLTKNLAILLIFISPSLMTLNYIQAISGINNVSPSEVLTTYNLVDLLSRFSSSIFLMYLIPKIVKYSESKYENTKKSVKRVVFTLILAIYFMILLYLEFTDTLLEIANNKNIIVKFFFSYSLLESSMSIIVSTFILVLGIIIFTQLALILKCRKILIVILIVIAIISLLTLLNKDFSSISDYATQYSQIYLNRFHIFTISLILTSTFYWGIKTIISESNLKLLYIIFILALCICILCVSALNKLNVNTIFFMLNFSGMICAIPITIYVRSSHFKTHFKKNSSYSLTQRIFRTIIGLLVAYIILLLAQNSYYWLLHSNHIKLNQLSYYSYFSNTVCSIVACFVIYMSQYHKMKI